MMDRDFFMNAGIQPPQQLDTAMGMNFIGLNFLPEQAFMEPNSSVNQYSQFQSALMSSMASSTSGLSNDAFALRELIGKLGGDGAGNFHPPSASTPYESCQSTPHKPHLPILDHVNRANLGNPVPLASLSTDPEFAVRAAKFSCFGSRSFNGRTAPIGLNNGKFLSRSGSPLMGSGKLPRVASSPVLKQQVGSPLPQIEIRANNGVSLSPGSEKKLSKLSCSGANSNEESSVSEQIPSGDTRPKTSNELNSRKRKAVSRGKPKEDGSNSAKEVGGEDDGIAKCPKTESEKIENVGAKTEEEAKEGSNEKSTEPFKDYIHVRARRGQATDSHSLAERVRREKIGERMKLLQDLVPGCNKVTGKALMLDEIINYVQSLQRQVEFLSMKLASVNPELDFNMNNLLTKDMYPLDSSSSSAAAVAFFNHHRVGDMAKAARERLNRTLGEHLNRIHETFQIFGQTPASSLVKVSWKEVIQMGEQISKQATMVGMLYTGENPGHKVLEENITAYVNLLQGFLLLSHGSSVGAGPTLSSHILASVKQVVDSSFKLLQGAVSSHGSQNKDQKLSISQLAGTVWEACSGLKKTPSTNVTAIGRAMTQVAVSVKDVLREMKELKPENSDVSEETEDKLENANVLSDEDLGNDLSAEEMKIAQLTTHFVSEMLLVLKELVRSITGLLQKESSTGCAVSVDSLEKLLKLCQGVGEQVDELGACLYPPQEIPAIDTALKNILSSTAEMHIELENLKGTSQDFVKACAGLKNSFRQLESQLCCGGGTGDLIPMLENLVVSD